ncbi:MAG: two-component system, OmpR family, response regulator [Acidimicrobiaceae bacterium]|jgi:two-component system OmpR family response regulator|nr:two-component system, OmpR family, response regulator [Acidimicrobiaceae bacterium]MDQ1413127.1 two-component system, OmpR family, response regulator [Acidimicrobiaceae bacterium]MDQ1420166.1 two-component system, OmpR family, response regulator [Acidimicrobiaceae bacterium]MDQ1440187.1 two-component system, OmpR family, response regulator [Acidimicrobiaceae bacterium]
MRLLVVDDEVRLAELIKRGLQEEGHAVDVVGDGPEAVWMAAENPYDAVILDVMLPTFDGLEVCRQLRQQGVWTPVLMLSARGEVQDRVEGLDSGADDYLAKPFTFAELGARLRALNRRGGEARPPTLNVGDLALDPAARKAWRGDTEVVLSAKEFSLLELLMRHPGEVLSRTRILEHGWDFAFDGVSNVVDQYIRYLRNKIDRPFGRHDLETVRGAGYRLRVPGPT